MKHGTLSWGRTKSCLPALRLSMESHHREWAPTGYLMCQGSILVLLPRATQIVQASPLYPTNGGSSSVSWRFYSCQSRVHLFPWAWLHCLYRFLHHDPFLPCLGIPSLSLWIPRVWPVAWLWIAASHSISYFIKLLNVCPSFISKLSFSIAVKLNNPCAKISYNSLWFGVYLIIWRDNK